MLPERSRISITSTLRRSTFQHPGQDGHRGNWSPTLLALGLFVCLVGVLAVAPLRAFFNLQTLDVFDFLIIGGAAVLWGVLLHTMWHFHLFGRFLQLAWEDIFN
jgi:hypothetical protein